MDPLKILLFIAAFVALVVVGRMLSRISEVHAASLPTPEPDRGNLAPLGYAPPDSRDPQAPAAIGAEIAFPIRIPPLVQRDDGSYNRPNILNYYFAKTDLLRGPENPNTLFDQLTIEAQDPGTGHLINYSFTVATPSGLREAMDQEKLASLYLDHLPVVVVPDWDLGLILHTVLDEIMKVYGADSHHADEHTDRTTG